MKDRRLFAIPLLIGLLLLPLGCGSPTGLDFLQPSELCSDHPDDAIATFEDANLEEAVRRTLPPGTILTCGLVSGVTRLHAPQAGIESLVGIQNLTSLTLLWLNGNSITDISALGGLTSLTVLLLFENSITDISALSGVPSLTLLDLRNNSIKIISALSGLTSLLSLNLSDNSNLTNIQPLLDNTGLGAGDLVNLRNTNVSCTDVAALEAKGVVVTSDCP